MERNKGRVLDISTGCGTVFFRDSVSTEPAVMTMHRTFLQGKLNLSSKLKVELGDGRVIKREEEEDDGKKKHGFFHHKKKEKPAEEEEEVEDDRPAPAVVEVAHPYFGGRVYPIRTYPPP